MKDFLDLCDARYSLRRFSDRPVERAKIVRCLEAARLAPSAQNAQPWRFVVFDDPGRKTALCDAVFSGIYAASAHFRSAPVLVALLVKPTFMTGILGPAVQGTRFALVDAGIAGEHFVLQAMEQGLGTCWIGWYDARRLLDFLGIKRKGYSPRGYTPVALIAMGYAPEESTVDSRKPQAANRKLGLDAGGLGTDERRHRKKRKEVEEIADWNEIP
jgi:nitroreductase